MEMVNRVLKSIEFIESNLISPFNDDALDVISISKRAAFSPWHFQRIFVSVTGETLASYIRKRRLSLALESLQSSRTDILNVALQFHFETQESFTRAFKKQFGITPGQARRGCNVTKHNAFQAKLTSQYLEFLNQESQMEAVYIDLPETFVMGYGANFICIMSPAHTNDKVIPPLWNKLFSNLDLIKDRRSTRTMGYCIPLNNTLKKNHQADECFYMACVEVAAEQEPPKGMEVRRVPAGKYAMFTHKGKLNSLEHTLRYIYGPWLLKSKAVLRDAPDLEVYDHRFSENSSDSEFDIYIPIE